MNVTFDTNIFVSGSRKQRGAPPRLWAIIRNGHDTLFISQYIVGELFRVLTDKFLWSEERLGSVREC